MKKQNNHKHMNHKGPNHKRKNKKKSNRFRIKLNANPGSSEYRNLLQIVKVGLCYNLSKFLNDSINFDLNKLSFTF